LLLQDILLDAIQDNPFNSRTIYEEFEIKSLAESLSKVGLLQPIKVRPKGNGYQLVYGHRRVRAARQLEWKFIKADVAEYSDDQLLQISLVENLERRDLSDYEKAVTFKRMREELGKSNEEIGELVGLSKGHISNYLTMTRIVDDAQLSRDPELKTALYAISEHHARYLNRIEDSEMRAKTLRLVVSQNLSVRDLQRMVQHLRSWFKTEEDLKVSTASPARASEMRVLGNPRDLEEIQNVLSCEFKLPKEKDFQKFAEMHAFDDGFSIYSAFFPWQRMESSDAFIKEKDWFYFLGPHLNSRIRDIRVRFFNDTALATLYVDQKGKLDGKTVTKILRGTVLLVTTCKGWKIVHEHWSNLKQ
jgi:ParB family chromosome partitioning protein